MNTLNETYEGFREKHRIEGDCPEICSCNRLSQLIMDDETLIKFRKDVCNTQEYKNCGGHLSELFGWQDEINKYLPKGMSKVIIK